MPAIYPTGLPAFVLQDGFSEKLNNQTIESQTDTGNPKVRRRFTKQIRTFSVTIQLDAAQRETFESFWQDTLAGGSLPFEWLHPMTRVPTTFRFRLPAPSYSAVAGIYIRASFALETI